MSKNIIEPISVEENARSWQPQNFLDRLAVFLLEEKDGRPRGFALQTLLDFVGVPTVFSIADALGALRGYLSFRQGKFTKGYIQLITAIMPGIPTGPVHYFLEFVMPDNPNQRPAF